MALKSSNILREIGEVRAATLWLDELTDHTNPLRNRVRIEAPNERYEEWSEVAKLMQPKDLLSVESENEVVAAIVGVTIEEIGLNGESIGTKKISDLYDDDAEADCSAAATAVSAINSVLGTPEQRIAQPSTAMVPDSSPMSTFSTKYSPSMISSSPFAAPEPGQSKVLAPIGSGRPGGHRKTDSNASSIMTTSTARPVSRSVADGPTSPILVTSPTLSSPLPETVDDIEDDEDVPPQLKSFFSHVLWRINQDPTTDSGLDAYTLLTNDLQKQKLAQRFGLKVKNLAQMREIIAREERDLKYRAAMQKKEAQEGRGMHQRGVLAYNDTAVSTTTVNGPTSPKIAIATRLFEGSPLGSPVRGLGVRTPESLVGMGATVEELLGHIDEQKAEKKGEDEDEDVVLLKPRIPTAPKASQGQLPGQAQASFPVRNAAQSPRLQGKRSPKPPNDNANRPVFDPNSFTRGGLAAPIVVNPVGSTNGQAHGGNSNTVRAHTKHHHGHGSIGRARGGQLGFGSRGNGSTQQSPRSPNLGGASNVTGGNTQGGHGRPPSRGVYSVRRGNQGQVTAGSPKQGHNNGFGHGNGHAKGERGDRSAAGAATATPLDLSQPIDPNVFSRGVASGTRGSTGGSVRGRGRSGGAAGGVRKVLWEP
jgi:hypothetical protein